MAFGTAVIDAAERATLRHIVTTRGEVAVATAFSMSRTALLRALAALPVRPSTAKLVRVGLTELAREELGA